MRKMQPVFVVDGMLGSLARKLRMFGFDTLYYNYADDDRLIGIGKQENRVILTCDKMLFQRAINMGLDGILLVGSNDVNDMVHVLKNFEINILEFAPQRSRCSLCNNTLDISDKNSVKDHVPPNVLARHEKFYFCKQCNKVYWEGSHLKKLQEFGRNVNRRLGNSESK